MKHWNKIMVSIAKVTMYSSTGNTGRSVSEWLAAVLEEKDLRYEKTISKVHIMHNCKTQCSYQSTCW